MSWEIMNVYGPVLLELKDEFLAEITDRILNTTLPSIVGGDLNLIRYENAPVYRFGEQDSHA
jgi:hypothetical protein